MTDVANPDKKGPEISNKGIELKINISVFLIQNQKSTYY